MHLFPLVAAVVLAPSIASAVPKHPPRSRPVAAREAVMLGRIPVLRSRSHGLYAASSSCGPLTKVGRVNSLASPFVAAGHEAWAVRTGWLEPSELRAWRLVKGGEEVLLDAPALHPATTLRRRRIGGVSAVDDARIFVEPGLVVDRYSRAVTEGGLPPLPGAAVVQAVLAGGHWCYLGRRDASREGDAPRFEWHVASRPSDAWEDPASWRVRRIEGLEGAAVIAAGAGHLAVADASGIHALLDVVTLEPVAEPMPTLPPGRLEMLAGDDGSIVASTRDSQGRVRVARVHPGATTQLVIADEDHDLAAFASFGGRAWLAALAGTEHASLVAVDLDSGAAEPHWIHDSRIETAGRVFQGIGRGLLILLAIPLLPLWPLFALSEC